MKQITPNIQKPYARGSYNKVDDTEQWIRISEGCPNNCPYCRETKECGIKPIYFDIPTILRNKVKIMDMNLMYKPKSIEIIKELGSKKVNGKCVYYEFICGVDWRYMDLEKAKALKENRFKNIRFAWDYGLEQQYKIKDCYNLLLKAGYNSKELMVFIISDWKIPFIECLMKLNLLKNWNVKVSPCFYDNAVPPDFQCNFWTYDECRIWQDLCSLHNQSVIFGGIYPDLKRAERVMKRLDNLLKQKKLCECEIK